MLIERKAFVAVIALAVLACAASPSFAVAARGSNRSASDASTNPADALDAMAQRKFGASISSGERKLLQAAPMRQVQWFGPSDDPDNAANDPAHGQNWGPDRTVRADFIA